MPHVLLWPLRKEVRPDKLIRGPKWDNKKEVQV